MHSHEPGAEAPDRLRRGVLVPVGGGTQKEGSEGPILSRFWRLARGPEARIVVIPTASRRPRAGEGYVEVFRDLGCDAVDLLRITDRRDAANGAHAAILEQATGIFLAGGNQLRLSTILGGTPLSRAIRGRNARGVPVAGTSAGAAILSEHMIAGGPPGSTPTAAGVILAPGLGLTNCLVIDQHFRQRDRLGRLLAAVSFNPFVVGIGLDEDTAVFLGPDDIFEVVGSGAVTVVDPSELVYSSMDSALPGSPVSLIGLQVHVLGSGARFDTNTREAYPPPGPSAPGEVPAT